MHVYFGTVTRGGVLPDGGELIKLDWDSKRVLAKAPGLRSLATAGDDPNPRGNARGYRGVASHADRVIAANYHTLQIYDLNLEHLRSINHGLMVDLHELYLPSDGSVWVCSTALDAALRYDLKTGDLLESLLPRQMPQVQRDQRALRRTPWT